MQFRACFALLLILSACATSAPLPNGPAPRSQRLANLQRAAGLPWKDGGQCVVREASQPWPMLVERCFRALDQDRIEFHDLTGRCAVASAEAATVGFGLCVLAAPELLVGAVVVLGVVVVGVAIKEALDAYELARGSAEVTNAPQPQLAPQEPPAKRRHKPEPSGQDWLPPVPTEPLDRERHARCEPIPVPHRGGDEAHNRCADRFPPNRYPGMDVLVDGKRFDALQVGERVLWEIKTDQFDTYREFLREQVVRAQVVEMRDEREIAMSCGYDFVVGVSTEAHQAALLEEDPTLNIVVTGCKR